MSTATAVLGASCTPVVLGSLPSASVPRGRTFVRNPAEALCTFKNVCCSMGASMRGAVGVSDARRLSPRQVDLLLFGDLAGIEECEVWAFLGAWPLETWPIAAPGCVASLVQGQGGALTPGQCFVVAVCARVVLVEAAMDDLSRRSGHPSRDAVIGAGGLLACSHYVDLHFQLVALATEVGPPEVGDLTGDARGCGLWAVPVTLCGVGPWYQGPGAGPPCLWSGPEVLSVVLYSAVNDPRARKVRNRAHSTMVAGADLEGRAGAGSGSGSGSVAVTGATKHQEDKVAQRWVDDKAPGIPLPVPVAMWEACCRATAKRACDMKPLVGTVVLTRVFGDGAEGRGGGRIGSGGALELLRCCLYLGLTGGYPYVVDPAEITPAAIRYALWRCLGGVGTDPGKWKAWLGRVARGRATRDTHGELLLYCLLVEYVLVTSSLQGACSGGVFPQPFWGTFPMAVVAAMSALRRSLCRSQWRVTSPVALGAFLGGALTAAVRAAGLTMPTGIYSKCGHLETLLDTVVRLRSHGYVQVGTKGGKGSKGGKDVRWDPGCDGPLIEAIQVATGVRVARVAGVHKEVAVLAPEGVIDCCSRRFGFLDRRTVCRELEALGHWFMRPEGGKRVVRDTVAQSGECEAGFEKPTPTSIAKDAMNALDCTKGLLATAVQAFVTFGTRPEVVTGVWSLFMDLTPGVVASEAPGERHSQGELVLRYAAAQSAGVARTGSEVTEGTLGSVVTDLVARMSGNTLCALTLVSLARQRSDVVAFCPWPQEVVRAGRAALRALHGPTIPDSASRVWVCFSCCVMYVVPVTQDPGSGGKRFAMGAHGVCCDPCSGCYGIKTLMAAGCDLCDGSGVMATCAHLSPTDSRGGKPKRCVTQLVPYDLARGTLRVLDVAVALCVMCGAKFRFTVGCWGPRGPTCPLCHQFRDAHGAFPVPADLSMFASSWGPVVPSQRRDLARACAICGVVVRAGAPHGSTLRVYHVPGSPGSAGTYRCLRLCKQHARSFGEGLQEGTGKGLGHRHGVFSKREALEVLKRGGVQTDAKLWSTLGSDGPGHGPGPVPGPDTRVSQVLCERYNFPAPLQVADTHGDATLVAPAGPVATARFGGEVSKFSKAHVTALMWADSILTSWCVHGPAAVCVHGCHCE